MASAIHGQCSLEGKSGKLPSSIPTAQGARRGQKTIAHEVGVSLEDNSDCQQLSGLWPSGLGSGLSSQPHREQDFLLCLFWKTQGGAEAHCTSPSLIHPSGWPNVDYQNTGQNWIIQGSVLLNFIYLFFFKFMGKSLACVCYWCFPSFRPVLVFCFSEDSSSTSAWFQWVCCQMQTLTQYLHCLISRPRKVSNLFEFLLQVKFKLLDLKKANDPLPYLLCSIQK